MRDQATEALKLLIEHELEQVQIRLSRRQLTVAATVHLKITEPGYPHIMIKMRPNVAREIMTDGHWDAMYSSANGSGRKCTLLQGSYAVRLTRDERRRITAVHVWCSPMCNQTALVAALRAIN